MAVDVVAAVVAAVVASEVVVVVVAVAATGEVEDGHRLEVLRRSADRPRGRRHQLPGQPLDHPLPVVRRCRALGRARGLVRDQTLVAATSDREIGRPFNPEIDRTSARAVVR